MCDHLLVCLCLPGLICGFVPTAGSRLRAGSCGLHIALTAHYSKTPIVRKISYWTERAFFQQTVIRKTNCQCYEGPLLRKYTLSYG